MNLNNLEMMFIYKIVELVQNWIISLNSYIFWTDSLNCKFFTEFNYICLTTDYTMIQPLTANLEYLSINSRLNYYEPNLINKIILVQY